MSCACGSKLPQGVHQRRLGGGGLILTLDDTRGASGNHGVGRYVRDDDPSATPVVVEDEVLIGANAVVIEGCRIGRGV